MSLTSTKTDETVPPMQNKGRKMKKNIPHNNTCQYPIPINIPFHDLTSASW
jgi:hypothetical protein